jgi:hypothetical protein
LDLPECVGSLRFQFVPVFISAREDSSTLPEDRSILLRSLAVQGSRGQSPRRGFRANDIRLSEVEKRT